MTQLPLSPLQPHRKTSTEGTLQSLDYDPATTVSGFCLRAHCKMRGKNDSEDKMVCRLVHNDCNMCRVDVYYLPPSFRSLSALFFLLPSPSSLPFSQRLFFLSSFLAAISLLSRPSHVRERGSGVLSNFSCHMG